MVEQAVENTDREIWRGSDGDSIHVTKDGAIGINCGGTVIVKPLREWHSQVAALSAALNEEKFWRETAGNKRKAHVETERVLQVAEEGRRERDQQIRNSIIVSDDRNSEEL